MSSINYLTIFTGIADTLIRTAQVAGYAVNVVANSTQPVRYLKLVSTKEFPLSCILDDIDIVFTLYNEDLTQVLAIYNTPLTQQLIYTLLPNVVYWAKLESESIPTIGEVVGTIQALQTFTVYTFFPSGFVNQLPADANVTIETNSYGAITYTFTDYPLTLNQQLNLATCGPSVLDGTITVTSSDPAVFDDINEIFVAPAGVNIFVQAKTTTLFTGTLFLSLSVAGTEVPLETGYVYN